MKIVKAKIRPEIFELIESGRKRFEVRSDDFEDASIIHYVSSETGETLGYYEIDEHQAEIHGGNADLLATVASVSPDTILECGLIDAPWRAYVAEIGYRIDDIGEWMEGAGE
ncbi:MAG: hypothetical protein ABF758_09085 [Bifidobacterium sp.]